MVTTQVFRLKAEGYTLFRKARMTRGQVFRLKTKSLQPIYLSRYE
jgi:hypothetical protein